ncbi:MAG: hypothetical protein Q4P65_03995 [Eubacteriales bacterium]|nr:hypothetical protein [Eubacteriales bacterium]
MKRIIIAFIIFSLCLGILGCSKSEEQLLQDHANSFLKSMKDLDLPAIYSFFDAEGEADSKAIDLKYIFEDFEDQESVESEYALRAMRSFFSMLDWEFVDFEVPDSEASDSENQVVLNYNLITPKLEYDKMIEIMERVQSKYSYLEAELSEMQADSLNDEASKRAYLEKIWQTSKISSRRQPSSINRRSH